MTARAFARGLACSSLYGTDYDSVLEQTVRETRTQLRLDQPVPGLGLRGAALMAAAGVVGLVWGLIQFALLLPLVPIGLIAGRIKNPRSVQEVSAPSTR